MRRIVFVFSMILAITAIAAPLDKKDTQTVPRYVCGVLDGTFAFEQWGTNWWDIYSIGEASGLLRHLGAAQMYTRHIPNLDYTLSDGIFKIVAANGDEIRGTYSGSITWVSEDGFQYLGKATFVVSEGTGRFVNTSGTIDATFSETIIDRINWSSASVTWTLSGLVSY